MYKYFRIPLPCTFLIVRNLKNKETNIGIFSLLKYDERPKLFKTVYSTDNISSVTTLKYG